ncbi:MAG: dihydroneopterin aldolase [Betaproteobacteria bacterium]|nr:dihydroneopterin aldolase [Betaproteobacteria bacterium]MBU6511991.1 dihydroneopterin aldolase [Betaproteobacteria bacterium]MDE1955293.1 dihydroneopterin aldolase [Betaproteobacteria bacterium]MDE2151476.1 dihydroneopterin aldolase [Betaproteobacteria bacterium]MDE2478226.1 dihydroneopterin aldolase [Betaproteobacteria bacterium]
MRTLYLERLRVQASVGILEHELRSRQQLLVSIAAELPDAPSLPAADDVAHVLDYRLLRSIALEEVGHGHVNMLETLAGRIAQRVLGLEGVRRVRVRVDKPNIFPDCDGVGIEVAQDRAAR